MEVREDERPEPADHGAALWDFLSTFFAARHAFLSIHRRYERRVLSAARERGVSRDALELPPLELSRLFHLRRLEVLRDGRLAPLRDLAQRVFGEHAHQELTDVYCNHVFHEISILAEEHRSIGRFVRIHDRRRYAQLFQEVSRYYPVRLRRVHRFFAAALRRIESLLPEWSRLRVIVRSVYLFGNRLGHQAYGEGIEALYRRMYPADGAVRGFLEAARSFEASGFREQAQEAARRALAAAPKGRRSPKAVAVALKEADALVRRLRRLGAAGPVG
jgi:hypothetical protein